MFVRISTPRDINSPTFATSDKRLGRHTWNFLNVRLMNRKNQVCLRAVEGQNANLRVRMSPLVKAEPSPTLS